MVISANRQTNEAKRQSITEQSRPHVTWWCVTVSWVFT